jgi:HSP20 family protein
MDRLWDDYFGSGRRGLQPLQAAFAPAVDVKESAEAVVVKAEVPGIDAQDINISVTVMCHIMGEKVGAERSELSPGGAQLPFPAPQTAGGGGR